MKSWRARHTIWVVGMAYTGLTVVMTWPMVRHLSLPYVAIQGDFGHFLWNLWWMKKALVELGTSPYFTSYLFYPTGTSLVFYNLSPYNGLVGIPLQLLGASVIATFNLLYLSSFVIGGVGMFLLVRELTGNSFAGFFAGAVYAFSPHHTVTYGTMNHWATQWLPFALLYALRVLRLGRLSDAIGLAITLVLATLADWHQPVFLLLTIIVLALSSAFTRHQTGLTRPGALRGLLLSFLLYGLLVSPLAYVVLREAAAGDAILQTPSWFQRFELLGFRGFGGDVVSYGALLGWIATLLMVYGIARGLDFWMKRFAALLVMFFVLSLGEELRLFGEPLFPLPFLLWRKIPLLGIIRGSIYFWIMVQVCFAVLAGHGMKRLSERMKGWHQQGFTITGRVVGAGLLALMLVEIVQAPLTPLPLRIHPVYEAIQRDNRGGAILDAPIGYTLDTTRIHAGRSMYLQTLHNHPLIGGHTMFQGRKRLAFLEQNPVLKHFMDHWNRRDEHAPDGAVEALRSFVTHYRIGWIILQKSMRDAACDERSGTVRRWSMRKIINLVAPAAVNEELRSLWKRRGGYCWEWDAAKASKADALVRRALGPPLWDDAELTAYKVR